MLSRPLCSVSISGEADEEMRDEQCLWSAPLPFDYTNVLQ